MSSSGKHINSPEQLLDFIKEKFSNLNQITKEDILNFRKDLESSLSLSPNLAININYLIEELTQVIKTKANPKQFIEAISSKNIINKSISTIKKDISTRGEKVDSILKELKTAAENANDKESVNDLEWIIQKLHEGDIYEINENFMENEHFKTEINKEGVDYMIQYSKIENDLQKSKDYSAVRKNNLNNKANNNEGKNTDEKSGNINTRSEPNFIIKKLNPELSIKITNILSKIDSPDFDIFSLDF